MVPKKLTLVCNFFPFSPVNKLPLGSRDSYVIGLSFLSGSCATYVEKAAFPTSHSITRRKPDTKVYQNMVQWNGHLSGSAVDLFRFQNIRDQNRVKLHAKLRTVRQ